MKSIKVLAGATLLCFLHLTALAADTFPLKQGLHQWPALNGKLFLVVGTYQDTTTFKRTYNFFFKAADDDAWNQVPVVNKKNEQEFTWNSAIGADVILADGTVAPRPDGVYFVVADKRAGSTYHDRGSITATWYRLTESGDDRSDDLAYQLKPVFTRTYPSSKLTVEDILAREAKLRPSR